MRDVLSRCQPLLPVPGRAAQAAFAELGNKWFRELFTASLAVIGCPDTRIRKTELMLGLIRFDTATDRSVQGSINIARRDLEAMAYPVPNVLDLDPRWPYQSA